MMEGSNEVPENASPVSSKNKDDPVIAEVKPDPDAQQKTTVAAGSGNSSGSWSWGSFLQKATSDIVGKSTAMVEFMKRDLTEFTETMQKDTAIIMNDATQSLKDKITLEEANKAASVVKSGISSFFGTINASLSMFDETTTTGSELSVAAHQTRSQAKLSAIQTDINTFKREPSGRPEEFEAWLITFDIDKHRVEMNRILDTVDAVQESYDKLVPSVVTHTEFWQRYFYRVYQMEKEERRIQSLIVRSVASGDQTPADLDLDWGDELDDATNPGSLLDPSEVCSVVSNESFQMVNPEHMSDRDVGDLVMVEHGEPSSPDDDTSSGTLRKSTGHHKTESSSSKTSSIGDWDQDFEDPVGVSGTNSRDEKTPTPD
ncbi:hypothetical protein RvY_10546 [Ramazzottius varieornatus]|uniref:BSD domain-containing protein n=1 Tax=Ramazzottius varieornatus TaxID=947166 RepID=A0A1D1VF64_RAMVA|nr:hypothetical protein RvY_10546 [Ramazzottius varieornatus]